MANKIEQKILAIKSLSLWDENARFPDKYFSKSEKELIAYFCSKKDFKIAEFAEEIANEFDLPQIEKIVVYDFKSKLIVLEGNRRLAAYKLLLNPHLTDDAHLKSILLPLKEKTKIKGNFGLECLVTKDKEQGLRYVNRKHLRGNNEVSWGDNERAHHNARSGNANQKELLKVAITKVIKELDLPEELKEQVLGPGYVTTFWRMIEQTPAWTIFGFSLNKNGDLEIKDKDFGEKLKVVILDVLQNSQFNNKLFSRLNVKEIGAYLKHISSDDYKRVVEEIEKHTKKNLFGKESVNVTATKDGQRSNPKSFLREYLIPKTCILQIQEIKINNIYCELKNDLLIDDSKKAVPNAVGVLFRVFLEITVDNFWEKKQKQVFADNTKLATKIQQVADYMEQKNIATKKQLENIRRVAIGKNNLLAIDNFHSYVHSYKAQPAPSDLKLKWDNLQEFFEILCKSLIKK